MLLLVAPPLFAQNTPEEKPASQPDAKSPNASKDTIAKPAGETTAAPASSSALDYLFSRKPQDGTAAKEAFDASKIAKTRAIAADALGGRLDDPQQRARFERYLSTAEVSESELKSYAADIQKLEDLLTINKTFDAWKQLYKLAGYKSIDAGVSRELANRIESIWNAGKATSRIEQTNDQLRDDIGTANRSADMKAQTIKEEELAFQQRARSNKKEKPSNNNGGVPSAIPSGGDSGVTSGGGMSGLEGKLQLTEEYLKSLEAKARIKLNELRIEKLLDQSKADFAEYITTLYNSGRHQHVLIAADFYRKIYEEGTYPVSMAQQVNAALEMDREVDQTVDTFRYMLGKNEVAAATGRLQEAFVTNELHPAVLGLERSQKERIGGFINRLGRMQNMMEARDFGSLETLD